MPPIAPAGLVLSWITRKRRQAERGLLRAAVAQKILETAYFMLCHWTCYQIPRRLQFGSAPAEFIRPRRSEHCRFESPGVPTQLGLYGERRETQSVAAANQDEPGQTDPGKDHRYGFWYIRTRQIL
jgi:hypothetical protein